MAKMATIPARPIKSGLSQRDGEGDFLDFFEVFVFFEVVLDFVVAMIILV